MANFGDPGKAAIMQIKCRAGLLKPGMVLLSESEGVLSFKIDRVRRFGAHGIKINTSGAVLIFDRSELRHIEVPSTKWTRSASFRNWAKVALLASLPFLIAGAVLPDDSPDPELCGPVYCPDVTNCDPRCPDRDHWDRVAP